MTGGSCYEGRFDEDDFEGAYRELDRRYYAGEGAAFAEAGVGDDRIDHRPEPAVISTGCSASSLPPTCASRTDRARPFRDRSAAELRASFEELQRHGRLGADVAVGGVLAVAELGVSPL